MKIQAILLGLIIAAVAFFAAACEKVTVARLIDNPSKYANKDVGIIGNVSNSYGVSILGQGGGVYKVNDGTGSIWVVTQRGVPTEGARVGVKGRVQNGVVYNGKNYGLGMIEDDRKIQ
jgi:hypothetical protein